MPMDYGSITEICYVVCDLEKSVLTWAETIGAGPFFKVDAAPQNIIYRGKPSNETFKTALGFSGSTLIEFIQPTNDEPSVWHEILRKGEGVHHIYPNLRPLTAVEYDAEVTKYEKAGLQMVWSSVLPPLTRNCFFDAVDRIGCFIELLQIGEMDWGFMNAIHQAHLTWDRRRPYRNATELGG